MRVNGFQCDTCCKIGNDKEFKGWFFTRYHETNSGYKEQHFCSLHCLHEWVEKQMPVVEEVKSIQFPFLEGLPPGARLFNDLSPQKDEYWRDL